MLKWPSDAAACHTTHSTARVIGQPRRNRSNRDRQTRAFSWTSSLTAAIGTGPIRPFYDRGYSMVWIGWQGDLAEQPSAQTWWNSSDVSLSTQIIAKLKIILAAGGGLVNDFTENCFLVNVFPD